MISIESCKTAFETASDLVFEMGFVCGLVTGVFVAFVFALYLFDKGKI